MLAQIHWCIGNKALHNVIRLVQRSGPNRSSDSRARKWRAVRRILLDTDVKDVACWEIDSVTLRVNLALESNLGGKDIAIVLVISVKHVCLELVRACEVINQLLVCPLAEDRIVRQANTLHNRVSAKKLPVYELKDWHGGIETIVLLCWGKLRDETVVGPKRMAKWRD